MTVLTTAWRLIQFPSSASSAAPSNQVKTVILQILSEMYSITDGVHMEDTFPWGSSHPNIYRKVKQMVPEATHKE